MKKFVRKKFLNKLLNEKELGIMLIMSRWKIVDNTSGHVLLIGLTRNEAVQLMWQMQEKTSHNLAIQTI